MFLFYPLLSTGRVGYPMTWKTALFMVWAGLRGAVSGLRLGSLRTNYYLGTAHAVVVQVVVACTAVRIECMHVLPKHFTFDELFSM